MSLWSYTYEAIFHRRNRSVANCRSPLHLSGSLWVIGGMAAAVVLLPILYLLVRVAGADQGTWALIFQSATLSTLGRTLGLALTVSLASAIIALPLAWLTTRTDLPFSKLWFILGTLPLVIPSYVGAYLMVASLGPRGMLSQL